MADEAKKKKIHRPVRTPTVLQMEAVECGAAALGILLAHFGRVVSLSELRESCGVSRDGSNAAAVLAAAKRYQLKGSVYSGDLDAVMGLKPPFIVFWNFNHFLVVEGFKKDTVFLNDPATGRRPVTFQEFDESFTGVLLYLEPNDEFEAGGQKPSVRKALTTRLQGSRRDLGFAVGAGLLLVAPGLAIPMFSQLFVDNVLVSGRQEWLRPLILCMTLVAGLQITLRWLQMRYLRHLRMKLAVRLSSSYLWHTLRLPVGYFAQRFAGEISSRTDLNNGIADTLSSQLAAVVIDCLLLFFYVAVMWQYDVVLTVIGVVLAFGNVLALRWIARRRTDANMRFRQEVGKVSGVSIAGLQSIETLKASALESSFFNRWAGYYTKATNAQQELGLTSQNLGVIPGLVGSITTMLILVVGGLRVMEGHLSIGMLVAFQSLMAIFQSPVNTLVGLGDRLQTLSGDVQRVDDVLGHPVDVETRDRTTDRNGAADDESAKQTDDEAEHADAPAMAQPAVAAAGETADAKADDASPEADRPASSGGPNGNGKGNGRSNGHRNGNGQPVKDRLQGFLELRDVTFGYSRVSPPLLENFSMDLRPGRRIALVGGSGSGKSTVAKLVCGLYQPWSGDILLDGHTRQELPRQVIASSLTLVDQDILFFGGSVRDNLTLWDRTVRAVDLEAACNDAEILDVVVGLTGGFEAELLEGASNLSGGQRQRLEIARALVTQPAIMVLDEATSALDAETEFLIDQHLRRRGCSTLVVAHRLSTIRDADEIIVLEQGKVVQRGTHDELWTEDGAYRRLIQSEGEAL